MSGPDGGPFVDSELLRRKIRLYLYGELSLAERREVERSRAEDPAFRALFEDEEAFLLSLGGPESDTEDVGPLLEECRSGLQQAVAREDRLRRESSFGSRMRAGWGAWAERLAARPLVWRPAVAALLLGLGFLAGRGSIPGIGDPRPAPAPASGYADRFSADELPTLTGIQAVQLDPAAGGVRIVVEERRIVTGPSSDPAIRTMLLETVRESPAGARLSSLEALRGHVSHANVRRAILESLLEDENPGVRLAALEAVRAHSEQPDVRQALLETVRFDPNAGMRVQAIQLLGEHPGRDLAGALQDILARESLRQEPNPYVLEQGESILHEIGASLEHF